MVYNVKVSTFLFVVCIASSLLAGVYMTGGFIPVPEAEYNDMRSQLNSSNTEIFFGNSDLNILYVNKAMQKINAYNDVDYKILTTIDLDHQIKQCCFDAHESSSSFEIQKTEVGDQVVGCFNWI